MLRTRIFKTVSYQTAGFRREYKACTQIKPLNNNYYAYHLKTKKIKKYGGNGASLML